jgi:DNA excision repair protein ERCC-2
MRHCTAVVCDYNYVFDPTIALSGLADADSVEDTFLIVDEAHNLVDRAREYFSPRLGRRAVAAARDLVGGYRQKVCRELEEILAELDEAIASTVNQVLGRREGVSAAEIPIERLTPLLLALEAQILPYFTFKRNAEVWVTEDPVFAVLLTLSHLLTLSSDGGKELQPLVERSGGGDADELLRLFCLDASRFTGQLLAHSAGAIAMSATLQPFEFYRDLLGFDADRTDTVALPSPFPRENRLILAIDEVDTSYRERSRHYGRIAELISELAPDGRNGLVLFPSYAFLREVVGRLHVPGHRVEIQQSDHTETLRREVLARLAAKAEPMLLLAVLGGVFAEGVDYPGEMLSAVVVVSPALPQVGPEREMLKSYFAERYERGFEYAYLIPGMTRVVQAAGRLIRSERDRGVIALVCKRFLRQPYVSLLPDDWLEDGVGELRVADPRASVRAFFHDVPENVMG